MIQNNTITGIDIGTDRIKIIVSQKKDNASFISPIYTASYESKGVHLGYITDKESVSKIIKKAINDAEKETKKE